MRGEKNEEVEQGIFRAVTFFYLILLWWIHDITHLSKFTDCTLPRVNPKVTMDFS